jgi:hypothetical protein
LSSKRSKTIRHIQENVCVVFFFSSNIFSNFLEKFPLPGGVVGLYKIAAPNYCCGE